MDAIKMKLRMYGLAYRLRKKGFNVSVKGRSVSIPYEKDDKLWWENLNKRTKNQILKLSTVYGFAVQTFLSAKDNSPVTSVVGNVVNTDDEGPVLMVDVCENKPIEVIGGDENKIKDEHMPSIADDIVITLSEDWNRAASDVIDWGAISDNNSAL